MQLLEEAVCEVMFGAVCLLGLFVLGLLHMRVWLLDAQPLPPTCVGWDLLQRIAWEGSGRAHDTVYPFLLNFLLLPVFPVLTQPLGYGGRKKNTPGFLPILV